MATLLAPDRKVCHVSVPKVASTTLQWLMADLAGLDEECFRDTLSYAPTCEQTVHAGRLWPPHLRVRRPTADDARAAGVDSDWFVFSVVRDPRERLWSAWQSKFLVRRRRYVEMYGAEPWFPRVPRAPQDVVEDFTRFVEALVEGNSELMRADAHFRPQAPTVLDGPFDVTNVYAIHDIPTLLGDLGTHLASYGIGVPELRRDNTTPLGLVAEVLEDGVGEAIVGLYSDDFNRLGHLWPAEPRTGPFASWSTAALRDVSSRVALHERVEDVVVLARDLKRQRSQLTTRGPVPHI